MTASWSTNMGDSGLRGPSSTGVARLGYPLARIDGPLKVCGMAEFPGDVSLVGVAHAAVSLSPFANARINSIDREPALACPGVLAVLTYEDVGEAIASVGHLMEGGWTNSSWRPLATPVIAYAGQIIGLVVAESAQAAKAGAAALSFEFSRESTVSSLADPTCAFEQMDAGKASESRRKGDLGRALAAAAVHVDASYTTPVQHHNAMELPSTTCRWDGDHLTVHEPTRYVRAAQHGLAAQLGVPAENVRVISRFIGGHFGSKLALSQHTAICALASKRLGRAVRLEIDRREQFTIANHRTETRHRIQLGADLDGRLLGLGHDAAVATSRFDTFAMSGMDVSTAMYAAGAVACDERIGRVDRNTPGPMRAPPEVPYLFALESGMDELAHALGLDPVELRRRNDTARDTVTGKPFTTRPLMRCFDVAARAFGWSARPARPRSILRDGWWIGYGCAAAARPVKVAPARIRLSQDTAGAVLIETAHHEIGNGLYTLLAATASERLGVPMHLVSVALGDSSLPSAGISGGSSTTTTLVNALAGACSALLAQPIGAREVLFDYAPPGMGPNGLEELDEGHMKLVSAPGGKLAWTFGAHMVEVQVHADSGEIRVARHVGAFAAGRVLNPQAARSQYLGGMIWGLSSALLESTEIDARTGAYVNRDLSEYLVPTSADSRHVEVVMVEDEDAEVNAEGLKGLGELGIIGVNAAIANAVFNATGVRHRNLPIRLDVTIE